MLNLKNIFLNTSCFSQYVRTTEQSSLLQLGTYVRDIIPIITLQFY